MNLLPNNWTYTKINDLISNEGIFVDGDWIESKDQNPKGKVRLIQLADIGDGIFKDRSNRYLTKEKSVELGCTYLKKQDILVARLPEPLGRACIFPLNNKRKYITAVDICVIRPANKYINTKHLLFLINSPIIRIEIDKLKSGTTRKRISRKNFAKIDFPIAPLNEQNRVVEKIEELFSDLDKATEELKKTQEQLKIYQQAVLKAAFEGKLTEKWREQNNTELSFEEVSLIDIAVIIMGQSPPSSTYNTNRVGLPFYQGKKEFGDLYPTPEKYCSEPKKIAESNDILISVRAPVGPTNFCKEKSCIGRGLAAIRAKEEIKNFYLFYYLRYFAFNLIEKSTGTTFNAISKDTLEGFKVSLFSLQEQQQIINEIESRLSVCDKLEETVQQSLEKIEYLRQSILKKAFEGKLVPQDPNDEPAEKLLERIKQEKEKFESNNKKRKKR